MHINLILSAALILGVIGLLAAIILYFVSKAFYVHEDPRIDIVCDLLPGANCGGCGFAGCRAMAETLVNNNSMEGCSCPSASSETIQKIAEALGIESVIMEPKIAVVRCNGTCENAPAKVLYDSAVSCAFATSIFAGESACVFGCLGCGDCVKACPFDAIAINPETKMPVVDEEKCVGCGKCVANCPRSIIELRLKGKMNRRVFVSCVNKEKGAAAKKNCSVACIGCGKCAKACPFEAITVENSLAYIDYQKCKLCRKCVSECPTGAICAVNFPAPKVTETAEQPATEN